MRLISYRYNNEIKTGAVLDDWIVSIRQAQEFLSGYGPGSLDEERSESIIPESMVEIIRRDAFFLEQAENTLNTIKASSPNIVAALIAAKNILQPDQIIFEPPVINPGKIICVGMNYPSNAIQEFQRPAFPILFLKSCSTLTGHMQPVQLPRISSKVVCEGELAVVIGRRGKHIGIESAHAYIAGYTIANDIGASDLEQRTSQWATGKLPDTFSPMGPELVTSDQVPNPNELAIKTHINGTLVQSGNTRDMIFNIPYLISYISSIATLFAGDIILSGSPKTIADKPAPVVYLNPGDRVSIEIEGIGILSNPIIQEEQPHV